MREALITFSIVSHAQNRMVNALLGDIARVCSDVQVIVTENIPDPAPLQTPSLGCPVVRIVNTERRGFGANHNAAFRHCRTRYFCICNPDIALHADPFPRLVAALELPNAGVAGPMVLNPAGTVEDSARRFPTPVALVRRAFRRSNGPDYRIDAGSQAVDWIAGMFMLFRSATYREIGGFDERYFLYYEDVDLCRRLRRRGFSVILEPATQVVHDAQRASRRKLRHAAYHARSILRYFLA